MIARYFGLVAVFLAMGALAVSGQSQRSPMTLDDVVNEIRALRTDLKQNTRTSTEMQLLTARLQLQEQRIATLANQRADVSARLATASQMRAQNEGLVQRFEEMRTRNEDLGISRTELDAQATTFKQQFETFRNLEQQLRAQESELTSEIANEQNRWQDFNSRLDELERSLK